MNRTVLQEAIERARIHPIEIRLDDMTRRILRGREIDPATGKPLTVSQWAARYRIVTTGNKQGLWRNDITPYAAEPMDCWSTPSIRKIMLLWTPQTSKTQIALNCIGYSADQSPGPLMYVNRDQASTERFSKLRLRTMFERSPRLASILSPLMKDNTVYMVRLKNGMDIMMPWASSAAQLSAEAVQYMIYDEVDKYQDNIGDQGREGDPIMYGDMRQNTYPYNYKSLYISTPSAYPSRMRQLIEEEADEVRRYYARCPYCGHSQIMTDDHLVLSAKTTDVHKIRLEHMGRYACDKCGFSWDDFARNQAVKNGYWKADISVIRPQVVAFLLPAWYSPEISLTRCIVDKMKADRDDDPKKQLYYVTQRKGEEYSYTIIGKTDDKILAHRCSGYDGEAPLPALPRFVVPREAVLITAGIDMQKYGFWYVIDAWAENFDSWMIDYGRLATWEELETLIWNTAYQVDGTDESKRIWRAAIDTGGGKTDNVEITRTEECYQWLRKQLTGTVYGIKGMSRPQSNRVKPIIIDKLPHTNRPIPGGLQLRLIDSSQFKKIVHHRFDREATDIGQHIYLHADTKEDFARQITAEELRRRKSGDEYWHQVRPANHLLDCKAYSAACVDSEWTINFSAFARAIKQAGGVSQSEPHRQHTQNGRTNESNRRW